MTDNELPSTRYDAIVVGAGFSGLYLLHKLRAQGFSALLLEAGSDVGGTWFWNRYPGARCDVESLQYQLGFPAFLQREWTWTERYSAQPEIENYLRFVADRLDLRSGIRFGRRVTSAQFKDETSEWLVKTDQGESLHARFCIMATGALSAPALPDIAGLAEFEGEVAQSSNWGNHRAPFAGKRVAVIGTGSSGVQIIPEIAKTADHLFVLQRSPNYVLPAYNRLLESELIARSKKSFDSDRLSAQQAYAGILTEPNDKRADEMTEAERDAEYERRWEFGGGMAFMGSTFDMMTDVAANDYARAFAAKKIRAIVGDGPLADALIPTDHPLGARRLCVGTDYYETYLRPNVTLVDLRRNPLEKFTRDGVVCGGTEFPIDMVVFATGFDAMTGALTRIDIRAGDHELKRDWKHSPKTYLGLAVPHFPNLFVITGPGSPSVLSNVVVSIEQHVDWVVDCMAHLRDQEIATIEATEQATNDWAEHVNAVAHTTLYPRAASWYLGANIPGKPQVFMPYVGGVGAFREKCDDVARNGYSGFVLGAPVHVVATEQEISG